MPLRLFDCVKCNHSVRFGARNCARCGAIAPILNWYVTLMTLLIAFIGIAFPLVGGLLRLPR